jgi:hypothetical protein
MKRRFQMIMIMIMIMLVLAVLMIKLAIQRGRMGRMIMAHVGGTQAVIGILPA